MGGLSEQIQVWYLATQSWQKKAQKNPGLYLQLFHDQPVFTELMGSYIEELLRAGGWSH